MINLTQVAFESQRFYPQSLQQGPAQGDIQLIAHVNVAVASISILGCIFNLVLTCTLKNSQYTIVRMVVGLSLMDLLTNVMVIVQIIPISNNFLCQIESFLRYFSYGGSVLWTCCFAHCLYEAINRNNFQIPKGHLKNYFLFSIGGGLVTGIAALAFKMRQIVEKINLCVHLNGVGQPNFGNWIINIIPVFMSIMYCSFCYWSVMKKLRNLGLRLHLELALYPGILIICTSSAIAMEVYTQLSPVYNVPFAWDLVTNILYNAQGALNAVVYGFSKRTTLKCKEVCCPGSRRSVEGLSVPQKPLMMSEMSEADAANETG